MLAAVASRAPRVSTLALAGSLALLGVGLLGCARAGPSPAGLASRPPTESATDEDDLDDEPPALAPSGDAPALTREEIRTVVRAKLPRIRACFELGSGPEQDRAAPDPTAPGPIRARVELGFHIDARGKARDVAVVTSDGADPAAAACLIAELGAWQFPLPRGGQSVEVRYPFVYSSEAALRAAGLPRVEGTVDPQAVGLVFDARRPELDVCLPDEAHGELGVALRIDDGGHVIRISSYADTLPEGVAACLLQTLSAWRFPPAASGDEARINHDLRW